MYRPAASASASASASFSPSFVPKQLEDVVKYFARFWPEACRGAGRGRYKESLQAGQAQPQVLIRATGGGSYKHAELFKKAGLMLEVSEEMPSIVLGLNFLMGSVPGEVFSVALRDSSPLASLTRTRTRSLIPNPNPEP